MSDSNNIALFIDYENVHYGLVNQYNFKPAAGKLAALILEEVAKSGNILIKKAYADWERDDFSGVQAALKKNGVEPAYTLSKKTSKGGQRETWKESADAVLLLDALQTMFERVDINEFVIVTGDRAALDLVHRLRSRGKKVKICALESALAQELTDAVEEEIISIEKLLGIEPVGPSSKGSTSTEPTVDWDRVVKMLAELEGKMPFVGCSLLKKNHGFTQQMIAAAVATGRAEIHSVPNPNSPERPTSALRLIRDNEFVINALKVETKVVTVEEKVTLT
ncbi:MAG: NYN domain-containing protein [Acidobacteriia bacterium]|nr:NYN domain-containing protein [Terriglobia bacterium]